MAQDVDVIGIDEAQFFDDELPNVCDELAYQWHPGHCSRAGYGLYRQTFWPNAFYHGQSRLCDQAACYLCEMRQYCQLFVPENS